MVLSSTHTLPSSSERARSIVSDYLTIVAADTENAYRHQAQLDTSWILSSTPEPFAYPPTPFLDDQLTSGELE
jgi:hypothetical protein